MKKYIVTTALCLAAVLPTFAQTKRVMTVIQKDGTTKEYKVSNIQNVTFTDKQLATLKNQWAYNDDVKALGKVTMLQTADANIFALYGDEADATSPVLEITMPQALMGKSIVLGSADAEGVKVSYNGEAQTLTGTVQAKFDKPKKNVTITLEAETKEYNDLRCKWNDAFTQVYSATNTIKTTNVSEVGNYNIASALMVKPATTGAATSFAFGDTEATTAEGLLAGKVGVAVSISASKLYNGTIDMVADANSYTLKYIDYATRITYDKVKAGTITTAQDKDGKLYITINATFDDNRTVELEYYGTAATVESLDGMIPAAVAANEYKYYNSDGAVSLNKELGTSYIDEYKGNYTFYFIPEGESKTSSNRVVLKVSQDLINAGEVSIADLGDTPIFDLKFTAGGMQLQSTAAGHGYGNTPNNGTLKIVKDDNDNYEVSLEIANRYKSPWGSSIAGDNTKLVLNFQGKLEKY